MRILRQALTVVVGTALLAGCGHAGTSNGLSEYDAASAAHDALQSEQSDPQSPLYRRGVSVRKIVPGNRPDGGGSAWLVWLEDFRHRVSPYCLWVWGSNTAFTTHYDYDLRRCPPPAT